MRLENMDQINEIFKGLVDDCMLNTLYIDDFYHDDNDNWFESILECVSEYVKSHPNQLSTFKTSAESIKYNSKIFEIISSCRLTKLYLQDFNIYHNQIPQLVPYLKNNLHLLYLKLSSIAIDNKLIQSLSKNLCALYLDYLSFDDKCGRKIIDYLATSNITTFEISYFATEESDKEYNHMCKIIDSIKINDIIKRLHISRVFFENDSNMSSYVSYVMNTTCLQSLDLSSCKFKNNISAVFKALHTNDTITKLIIRYSGINSYDFEHIHNMLIVNQSITSLDISNNKGRDVRAIWITKALFVNEVSTLDQMRLLMKESYA